MTSARRRRTRARRQSRRRVAEHSFRARARVRAKAAMPRPLFVAATRQHVGKTTVSLALMAGLQKRFNKVGYIKPVGQQHVEVKDGNLNGVQ
eukprot:6191307-Pleurochrysis_carterae.AAC.3